MSWWWFYWLWKAGNLQTKTALDLQQSNSYPNPKANIHSTWPRWLGFKRQSFIKRKEGLGAGQPISWHRRTSELHPACPKEAAQAFLWAVWAEPGARTDEPFLFHTIHSPTWDMNITHFQNKRSPKTSVPLPHMEAPNPTIKHPNTHIYTFFLSLARMSRNVFS